MADQLDKAIVGGKVVTPLLVGPTSWSWSANEAIGMILWRRRLTIIQQTVLDVVFLARGDQGDRIACGQRIESEDVQETLLQQVCQLA